MHNAQPSCQDVKTYLCRFYEILEEMIQKMTSAQITCNISQTFIRQMIPHHEAAIQMSQNILQYTCLAPLQKIAENIITEQTKSIEDMRRALHTCDSYANTYQELCRYQQCFQQITQMMFCGMRNAPATDCLNADFMREMIPHHKGAIRMSKNALRFPICPELKPILEAIITSQEQGMQEMEQLLCCL